MRSIERRFKKFTADNPGWSSYVCFAEAIRGQGFSHDRMSRWFNRLVSSDEYSRDEKGAILAHLDVLNWSSKRTGIKG